MKSLAKLKDDARRHEQREEWQYAIDLYLRVLRAAEEGETEVELPLFNRIGDLYVRLGRPAEAVRYYEQAADRYADVGLFNNAIALCNKALRYLPDRLEVFRKLGRYSASQGFLTDARHWFLEYAQRKFGLGELDDAFGALEDFAAITDDPEVRADFARQLLAHGRSDDAVTEFRRAYAGHVRAGDTEAAERLRQEASTLLPDAGDLDQDVDLSERRDTPAHSRALPGFGESRADELPPIEEADGRDEEGAWQSDGLTEPLPGSEEAVDTERLEGYESTAAEPAETLGEPDTLEGLESTRVHIGDVDHVDEIEGFDTGRADDAPPLPLLDDQSPAELAVPADDAETEAEAEPAGAEEQNTPLPLIDSPAADERHAADDLYGVGTEDYSVPPPAEEPLPAFEPDEPQADEGEPVRPTGLPSLGEPLPAGSDAPQPLPWDAGADHDAKVREEYVDLFAFINPDEDRVLATRFFVEEKQPTGDEDRDFAEMLAEFKAKVAAHVGEDDSGSHYDLGLAFKEMGLIDEAIGEFQVALRAGANRLKVFEELGQCFILKRQPTIAVKILARALQIEHEDELELIGVYYHLGRAYEELGNTGEARDAYERVLGLDIGFKDVMDRVTRL